MTASLPDSVRIVEVGPRDGLQNESEIVSLETKIAFVNALSDSGLGEIEVTSFVSPKAVPQLADAAELLRSIHVREGVRYSVLVPNVRGVERWLECAEVLPAASRGIALFTAASETFNQRNVNASIQQSLQNFRDVIERVRAESMEMPFVRGYVSTAFICPYEGRIEPEAVRVVASELMALGVDEISLGDTIGAATPRDVSVLLEALAGSIDVSRIAMHFHDTRGTALANVLESLRFGIRTFDSSAAGLGGCPFAPGALGNVATEDLVYMLTGMRVETGVDLKAVVAASEIIRPAIKHGLASRELQAFQSAGF